MKRLGILLLLLAVVVVAAVSCLNRSSAGLTAGTVIEVGSLGDVATRTTEIRLPNDALTVPFTAPMDRIPKDVPLDKDDEGRNGNGIEHAGRVVGFTVGRSLTRGRWENLASTLSFDDVRPTLTLHVGSDARTVTTDETAYVVLPHDGAALSLTVAFDGQEQQVDLLSGRVTHGAAAPYYRAIRPIPVHATGSSCSWSRARPSAGDFMLDGDDRAAAVHIERPVLEVPHLDGLGWAPAGNAWRMMTIDTSSSPVIEWPHRHASVSVTYGSGTEHVTVTADGAGPVSLPGGARGGPVFEVRPGAPQKVRVVVRMTTTAPKDVSDWPGPAKITAQVTCDFQVG